MTHFLFCGLSDKGFEMLQRLQDGGPGRLFDLLLRVFRKSCGHGVSVRSFEEHQIAVFSLDLKWREVDITL